MLQCPTRLEGVSIFSVEKLRVSRKGQRRAKITGQAPRALLRWSRGTAHHCALRVGPLPPSHSFFHSFCPLLPAFLPPLALALSLLSHPLNQSTTSDGDIRIHFATRIRREQRRRAAAPYLEWPIGGERRREERGRGREWRIMPPPQRHCHPRARNLPSEQSGAPELFLFIGETSSTL